MLRSFVDVINTALLIAVILVGTSIGLASFALILILRRAWQGLRALKFAALSANAQGE